MSQFLIERGVCPKETFKNVKKEESAKILNLPWKIPNNFLGLDEIEKEEYDDFVIFQELYSPSVSVNSQIPCNIISQSNDETHSKSVSYVMNRQLEWTTLLTISFGCEDNKSRYLQGSFKHLRNKKNVTKKQTKLNNLRLDKLSSGMKQIYTKCKPVMAFDKDFFIWNIIQIKLKRSPGIYCNTNMELLLLLQVTRRDNTAIALC